MRIAYLSSLCSCVCCCCHKSLIFASAWRNVGLCFYYSVKYNVVVFENTSVLFLPDSVTVGTVCLARSRTVCVVSVRLHAKRQTMNVFEPSTVFQCDVFDICACAVLKNGSLNDRHCSLNCGGSAYSDSRTVCQAVSSKSVQKVSEAFKGVLSKGDFYPSRVYVPL